MSLFGFSNITLLLPYFWGVPIIFGIASFIGSYIWGMLTAKDLKVKAESNSLEDQQGDEKARIKQKSKLEINDSVDIADVEVTFDPPYLNCIVVVFV